MLEAGVAADHVAHHRRAGVVDAQTHRTAGLGLAAKAPLGSMALLIGAHVLCGGGGAIRTASLEQRLQRLRVALGALALEDRPLVPVELQPAQRAEDLLDVLRRGALSIGVLDPEDQLATLVAGKQPVEQSGARTADVQHACGRRREANPHNPPAC